MDDETVKDSPHSLEALREQADREPAGLVREFWDFLCHNKKWWLIPILAALFLVGGLVVLVSSSSLAPFIYALF